MVTEEEAKFYRDKHVLEYTDAVYSKNEHNAEYYLGVDKENYKKILPENVKENVKNASRIFNDKMRLAQEFYDQQPIFFDDSGSFWLWDANTYSWIRIEREEDIANMIYNALEYNTINSKERTEIFQALKQIGRMNKPKELPNTWIQFKNGIIDLNNPTIIIHPSPEYFTVNPIPHNLGTTDQTPMMDIIFEQWVGKEYVPLLYEILAYCLLNDYPIHRLFCFIGEGLNGKSKFLELLRRFIGANNCCSTELDALLNSRFEVTRLYKKMVCQMGETNFAEMSKTSILKKLTGDDLIGFEFKNKNPFEAKSYAKILISTNNLPATTDKTIGFYRRWLIIDFPNKFNEKRDILKDIPDIEYENLAFKSVQILSKLLEKREFHKEGSIEERRERYESKSNFLEKFFKEFVKEDTSGYITKSEFYKRFSEWSRENKHREVSENSVGASLKKLGVEEGKKYFEWLFDGKGGQARVWFGISWK